MKLMRTIFAIATGAVLLCASAAAFAQTAAPAAPHVPLQKSIGQTTKGQFP